MVEQSCIAGFREIGKLRRFEPWVGQADDSIIFRVAVTEEGRGREVVLEERVTGVTWTQRSVDLSAFSGRLVDLAFETEALAPGAVGFWGARR